jgi:hypothetical protein
MRLITRVDPGLACLVPRRVETAEEARAVVADDGAAILAGLRGQDAAMAAGRAMLGADCARFGLQFEATKDAQEAEAAMVAAQPADERGRKRRLSATGERMAPHNDGFGFGDFAPDYLFLWCERPDPYAGASFLIDGLRLLRLLGTSRDPADAALADFCWTVPIDQSEPNFPLAAHAPIARPVGGGRASVRCHPFQAPAAHDPDARRTGELIDRWRAVVTAARDAGPMFRVEAGEMICVDNYRMTHGRDGYTDPARRMLSIWGWSTEAIAVPEGPLDIVRPVVSGGSTRGVVPPGEHVPPILTSY